MLVKFFKTIKRENKILKKIGQPAAVLTRGPRGNLLEGGLARTRLQKI